jgi:hypothetical protein
MNNNQNRNAFVLVDNAKIVVAEGATLNAYAPVRCRNTDKTLTKSGAGLWLQRAVMFNNVATTWSHTSKGSPILIEEGEWRYDVGGATHTIHHTDATTCPVTIQSGAKLSGDVVFPEKAPVTFAQGTTVHSGVVGLANSALTFHTVTFSTDMVIEADLTNFKPLTITNTARFRQDEGEGKVVVRLMNMGTNLTEEKQLIAWPAGTNYVTADFTSPEAVALSAELKKQADGLWLVPSESSYDWVDKDGNWSESGAWTYRGEGVDYPTNVASSPVARVVANTTNVELTLNSAIDETAYDWAALSMVTLADSGKSVVLKQGGSEQLMNTVLLEENLWKLGKGDLVVEAPIKLRASGAGSTLNVAEGMMTLKHPLISEKGNPRTEVPTAIDIAEGATLEYALDATFAATNMTDSLTQTLVGPVTGEGTLRLNTEGGELTIKSTADSNLDVDVAQGTLVMASELPAISFRSATRTMKVAAGAQVDVKTEKAMGGATNTKWILSAAAEKGAIVTTETKARIRGSIDVTSEDISVATVATFGSKSAQLDNVLRVNVAKNATLTLGGDWDLASNAASSTSLTKMGEGTMILNSFWADVPVTISNGTLELDSDGVSILDTSEIIPIWSVNAGATLLVRGGEINLSGNADETNTAGRLEILGEGTLACAMGTTAVVSPTTIASRAVIAYGHESARLNFTSTVQVNGIVDIDMGAVVPNDQTASPLTLMTFGSGKRSGVGTFQLSSKSLNVWAENGWTLRDEGTSVVLQRIGADGYYIWAGDGSEDSTGNGNWANAFWVNSKNVAAGTVAWPTEATSQPSIKLQDVNPITGKEIPKAARTLDWTMDKQTLASIYVDNKKGNYTLTSSNGSADLSIAGDFLKVGEGALTVNRATVFGTDGALRLLGGSTTFTGLLTASSGDFNKPVTVSGETTQLRLAGNVTRSLKGLIEGDGTGTIVQEGSGLLRISNSIEKLGALAINQGAVELLANEQYVVSPVVTMADGATLTLGGIYTGAGTIKMQVNANAEDAQGLLVWNATTATSSDRAPRFGCVDDDDVETSISVETFRYQPKDGHLIIDPNTKALKPGFNLEMNAQNDKATSALWLGAQAEPDATLRVTTLSGAGVIGVEPTIDLLSDAAWGKMRLLTVESTEVDIANVKSFAGAFMGASTPASGDIRIGMTVKNGREDGQRTYFRYSGLSTNDLLGVFSIEDGAAAEITGTWAGDVTVANGGLLMGCGTVGAATRTVSIPEGATISATTYGKRVQENNTFTTEVVPTELTIKGKLALEAGSVLDAMIYKNENGDTWASLIKTETLNLPATADDEEVKVVVNVTLEPGVVASGVKLLGWDTLEGGLRISGTVKINGVESDDYQLLKKENGLYLYRKSARFLLILQ